MLKLPIGQLFRDIGIAISVAVLISVIVSVTVIPTLSARLLAGPSNRFAKVTRIPLFDLIPKAISYIIIGYTKFILNKKILGTFVVICILCLSVISSYKFLPRLDYLPDGNANFVFGRLIVPPGYSMDETFRIAEKIESAAKPLWEGQT